MPNDESTRNVIVDLTTPSKQPILTKKPKPNDESTSQPILTKKPKPNDESTSQPILTKTKKPNAKLPRRVVLLKHGIPKTFLQNKSNFSDFESQSDEDDVEPILEASDESLDEGFKDDQEGEIGFESQSEDGDGVEPTVIDQQVVGSSQACVEEVLSEFNDLFESGEAFEHDVEHGNNDIFLGDSSDDENDRQFEVVARFGPCSQDTFNLGDPESDKEDEDWDPVDVHSSRVRIKKINELTVKLRKYNDIHTYEADEENKVVQAKAPWVANELEAFARAHPTFSPVDLFNEIYHEYGVHISYWTAWRARIMLLEKMHAAKASGITTHEAFMDSIEQADKDAKKWLEKESRKTWARSYFDLTPNTDAVTSNCCESFNSWILKIRDKPLMQFVDKYTLTIMSLMYDRREIGDGLSEGDLVPAVQGNCSHYYTVGVIREQLIQAISIQLPIKNTGTRPGRPKKQRIRGNDEEKASGKRKCRNCGEVGHNARTCKEAAKETSSSPSRRGNNP
ncbi:hypothetical protein IFM89_011252 [Coptis chinensis]|uniref:CCHC-type domain-containing protein n=1 Tax=Coptis chinensis TaxID=261450 RepID=A0A835LRD4_9MAGN|nr:hypothetical protein IFM89_011252 [Coptis chinensis]